MTWTDKEGCSSCRFCGMDMDMGPYCGHPLVRADYEFGLAINLAIQKYCGEDLTLREPRNRKEPE